MSKKSSKPGSEPAVEEKGPVAQVENAPEGNAEGKAAKVPPYKFDTTDGKVIKGVEVKIVKNGALLHASYGEAGKEKELKPRVLSAEQLKAYSEMSKTDPKAAKDTLVRELLPHHADDKAFKNGVGVVAGQEVTYVVVHKIDAQDVEAAKTPEDKAFAQALVDKNAWRLSWGAKGTDHDFRESGLLTKDQIEIYANRGIPVKNEKGFITAIGKPVSKLELANMAAPLIKQVQAERLKLVDLVNKTDWSRFKYPEGAEVKKAFYSDAKAYPGRLFANATVNGSQVSALLEKHQSFALQNGNATIEQAFMANKDFRSKVDIALHPEKLQEIMDKQSKGKTNEQKAGKSQAM